MFLFVAFVFAVCVTSSSSLNWVAKQAGKCTLNLIQRCQSCIQIVKPVSYSIRPFILLVQSFRYSMPAVCLTFAAGCLCDDSLAKVMRSESMVCGQIYLCLEIRKNETTKLLRVLGATRRLYLQCLKIIKNRANLSGLHWQFWSQIIEAMWFELVNYSIRMRAFQVSGAIEQEAWIL